MDSHVGLKQFIAFEVGNFLKVSRELAGLSPSQAAARLNFTETEILEYEKLGNPPACELLRILLDYQRTEREVMEFIIALQVEILKRK